VSFFEFETSYLRLLPKVERIRYIFEDSLKQEHYLSKPSNSSSPNRRSLEPQRDVGRQRVADLMQAAAAVIQERGFEAATMAEIAARADARIGSLYRFFPSKEAVADALMQRYAEILQAEYDAIHARAAVITPEELADALIDLFVKLHPQAQLSRHSSSSEPTGRSSVNDSEPRRSLELERRELSVHLISMTIWSTTSLASF
jgi:AcrR family transcriptional regulator